MNTNHKKLISELYICASQCDACYVECSLSGKPHLEKCMALNRECYNICRFTASVLQDHSDHLDLYMNLCMHICQACAEECSRHPEEHCRVCAKACNKCAQLCLEEEFPVEA